MIWLAQLIELWRAFLVCGMLSFGGGYAMIPLVERELIARRGWLDIKTFTEIIAVAEMTPGPVAVNTATFVGFRVLGLPGALAGTLAVITVPAVFAGTMAVLMARYGSLGRVQAVLGGLRPAACALLATAALSVARGVPWDVKSVLIGALAALALWRRISPLWVIGGSAVLGLLLF